MNVALGLTIARLASVPVVAWLMLDKDWRLVLVATVIFSAAALSDLYDGRLARRRGEVTKAGVMLDPIADKCLVLTVMFAFVSVGLIPLWMVALVTIREVVVTGVRLWMLVRGRAIAAQPWGKHKTIWQMVTVGAFFVILLIKSGRLLPPSGQGRLVAEVVHHGALALMWVVIVLSLISGVDFFAKLAGQKAGNGA